MCNVSKLKKGVYRIMKSIYVVDDEIIMTEVVQDILSKDYIVKTFNSSEIFLNHLQYEIPDLVLCDIVMPEHSGYEIVQLLKHNPNTQNIPIVFLTSMSGSNDHVEGLKNGALDYIVKPITPDILKARLNLHFELISARKLLEDQNKMLNIEVEKRIAQYKLIQQILYNSLSQIVDLRDNETGHHILRTKLYVKNILIELSRNEKYHNVLTALKIETISEASVFHDIGKVVIPDAILNKPGKLDEQEWDIMKSHVLKGKEAIDQSFNVISQLDDEQLSQIDDVIAFLDIVKNIILYHHERFDGTGYPYNLSGEDIPLEARVMAVADVFDALLSDRPYKKAWSFDKSFQYIIDQKFKHFDPDVVNAFQLSRAKLENIYQKYLRDFIKE